MKKSLHSTMIHAAFILVKQQQLGLIVDDASAENLDKKQVYSPFNHGDFMNIGKPRNPYKGLDNVIDPGDLYAQPMQFDNLKMDS